MNKVDSRNAFFDKLVQLAIKDDNVIILSADTDADSLKLFKKKYPYRFINTGVAEQQTINLAAGLALTGKKVFIYSLLPFITMRCFEQIKLNICSLNLPITIIGFGTGLTFSHYGPAGHGVIDIGVMRMLPEMQIFNPCDPVSLEKSADIAYKSKSPTYIRLFKGRESNLVTEKNSFSDGFRIINKGKDICIICTGTIINSVINAKKKMNHNFGIIDLFKISPIPEQALKKVLKNYRKVITVEDNIYTNGIGSIISEINTDNKLGLKIKKMALKNEQCFKYGDIQWLLKQYHLDEKNIIKGIKNFTS